MQTGKYAEAKDRLQTAYDMFVETREKSNPEFVNIANDLSAAYAQVNTEYKETYKRYR